jgi:lipopolysaccharide export system protein LptA
MNDAGPILGYNNKMMRSQQRKSTLRRVLFAVFLLPALLYALPSDRDQEIRIKADEAEINEVDGYSVYRGNVTFDQGTIRISADQIEVLVADSEIIEIIASTNPTSTALAHYQQQPESDEGIVYADAREITYYAQEERLNMIGQAKLRQTDDSFSGELLKYDVKKGTVSLIGKTSPEAGTSERVEILLSPQKQ